MAKKDILGNRYKKIVKGMKKVYINENNLSLLQEGRESKHTNLAKKYWMNKHNCSQEEAMKVLGAIKHDIANVRLAQSKFLLGVTRLYDNGNLRDGHNIMSINKLLHLIASDTHVNDYDSNLNGMSLTDLETRLEGLGRQEVEDRTTYLDSLEYTNNGYEMVRVPDFETAKQYGDYTSWCVTHKQNMYNNYTHNGLGLFYFFLKNGFEEIEAVEGEGCPLDEYGLSMIAVSVNDDGTLNTVTCRWNHDNGGNDSIMDDEKLSLIVGGNIYRMCKPYTDEELKAKGLIPFKKVPELLAQGVDPREIFDDIDDFDEGCAEVQLNGKFNFITTDGRLLSPNQWFDGCYSFSEGFSKVELNGKDIYIKEDGVLYDYETREPIKQLSQAVSESTKRCKKIYINEEKLSILRESKEEVTFYGFFTQIKNFLKQLLTNPATAEPSDILKKHGLNKDILITKLKKKGLLKSDENITEVPIDEAKDKNPLGKKLRAKYTIKYSVPRLDFEKKMHRLYTEIFESEWKDKNVMIEDKKKLKSKMPEFYFPLRENRMSLLNSYLPLYKTHKFALLEGLMRTFPIETIRKEIKSKMSFTDTYEDFVKNIDKGTYNGCVLISDLENGEQGLDILCYNNDFNDNMLKKISNLCGYSLTDNGFFNGIDEIKHYELEKKHKNSINDEVKKHPYIYHITKEVYLEKILTNGLEPRTKNKRGTHDSRIYFMLNKPNDLEVKNIAHELYHDTNATYVIIEIKTEGLNCNFYYDPNVKDGIYTQENIHPSNIMNYGIFDLHSPIKYMNESFEMQMDLADKLANYVNDNKDKPRSFFANEDEEIQKILDNDIDGAYKNRGGYKLSEMTLKQAIKHCQEKVEELKDKNCDCSKDHAQLEKWLKELEQLRKKKRIQENIENEISSKFIQRAIQNKFSDDDYNDANERDKRIRDMRYKAVDKYNDEHPNYYSGLSNEHSDDEWLKKYSQCPLKILDSDYNSLEDLYNGVKSGRLLIHCREMQGIEDGLQTIYPEAGQTVQDAYGAEYAEYDMEIPELVFASDNFNWAHNTRNGIYFIESDNFQRSLGDGRVQYPNGEISNYCLNNIPLTVESGDWYSDEPADVVAYMNTQSNNIEENSLPKIDWDYYLLEKRGIKSFNTNSYNGFLVNAPIYKYGLKKIPLNEVADNLMKKDLSKIRINEELGISNVVDEESQKIFNLIANSLNSLKETKNRMNNIIIKEGEFEIELFDSIKFTLHLIQQDCRKEMFRRFCMDSGNSSWDKKTITIQFITINEKIQESELMDTIYHEFEHLYQSFKKNGTLIKNQDAYEYAISLMKSKNQYDNILGRIIYLNFNIEEYALNQGMYGYVKNQLKSHLENINKNEIMNIIKQTELYKVYNFMKHIEKEINTNKELMQHTSNTNYSLSWYQKSVSRIVKNINNNIGRTIIKLYKDFNL